MNDYLQVEIKVNGDEDREILIAQLISIGYESFEESEHLLKAFIRPGDFNEEQFRKMMQLNDHRYEIQLIPEKNWNEEWEKNFDPVVIGDFCTVRAHFHSKNFSTRHDIVITPKMSFGTGHHATTSLMLEFMQDIEFTTQSVVDFGTGTGILAIMAEKLGARTVVAIDVDGWSIRNAEENLQRNNCSKVVLFHSDNIPADKSFKIILANINRNVILDHLPDMCKILAERGEILLSGLMEGDFEEVQAQATKLGLRLQKKGEKLGWIALRYQLLS